METNALDSRQPPLFGRPCSEFRRVGSPCRSGICLFFCDRTLKINALCSNCCRTSKRFGKSELAGSVFKLKLCDDILKDLIHESKGKLLRM